MEFTEQQIEFWERQSACVNALAGIPDPAAYVKAMGEVVDVMADLFEIGDVQVMFAGNPIGCAHLEQRARTALATARAAMGERA